MLVKCSLRFISGGTPADLLMVTRAAGPVLYIRHPTQEILNKGKEF